MSSDAAAHRNRLASETSPYLLQHATNPVDWYPWGEEAFAKARDEDRPILLSVGYSACHWCHVMAHECFENEEIAGLMNQWFVSIKVDREERPDVDSVYMTAVQSLTGQGGWPMTVFMTPDGRPFYAGTYFPPEDAFNRPGFPRIMHAIRHAWDEERESLLTSAERVAGHLRHATQMAGGDPVEVTPEMPRGAVDRFLEAFDTAWGGFGGAPKFPSPGNLEFLLAYHARSVADGAEQPQALEMALHTLRQMAAGGMYDHLGGGFARYSVDAQWLVPHFEKMLYDNAQLSRVYLHALQVTGDPFFGRIARETLDYLAREMLDAEGGFYAAQDADSEGVEGKFFVWTVAEVERALGDDAALFSAHYGVTPEGNFEDPHHPELAGRNVLTTRRAVAEVAAEFGLTPDQAEAKLAAALAKLLAERETRVRPGLDDKVLTSWNGLALAAFAEAARVLGDERYRAIAGRNAAFVRENLWRDGRLLHTYKAGVAKVDGLLEDYAYYGLGLVELFKLTGDMAHLDWARDLFEAILVRFRDPEHGGFFETPDDGETLLLRQKQFFDAATPGGNGAVALLALWLGRYCSRPDWEAVAGEVLGQIAEHLHAAPTGVGSLWQTVEFMLSPHRELVIVGEAVERLPLEREASRRYLPWLVLAPTADGDGLPMFEDRAPAGPALAYLCENMTCKMPAATPEQLASQLD
jgi:hypothetical protein